MARRRHRALRAIGWIFGGLVSLILVAVVAALAVLHTDWGRERMRRIAETQLNGLVDGKVTVGRITGSPLSHFEVRGLTVDDPEGQRVITVGTFGLDWDPLALVSKRFHARNVDVVGPIIMGERRSDGTINLAHLLKPKTEEPDTGPSPWKIVIDKLNLRDGLVVMPLGAAGERMSLANVAAEAAIHIDPTTRAVTLASFSANWIERGLPVDARGHVLSSTAMDMVSALEAHAGGSRVSVPFALYDPKGGALTAIIDGAVREADLFHFWPHAMAVGDATFGGAIARTGDRAPLDARLHASALHGQIWTKLTADLEARGVKGELRVRGVRAPGPTPGRGDLDASFDLAGTSVATAKGTLSLSARGDVSGRHIERLKVDATVGGGIARADGTISAEGAQGQVHADVRLGTPITIEAARLRAQVADLGAVAPGVKGSATADVSLSGTPTDLAARGRAQVAGVAAGSARVASANVDFDLRRRGENLAGGARLDAFGVSVGPNAFGRVRADAQLGAGKSAMVHLAVGGKGVPYAAKVSGKVTLEPKATRIDFGELALSSRGLALNGRGGTIILHKGGAFDANRVALASAAGTVEVTGHLAAPRREGGRFAPEGELHLHVAALDLARVRTAFAPNLAAVAGKVSLDLHAVRDGTKLGLEGEFSAQDLIASSKVPPIDAIGRVNIGDGRLVANGHVRERVAGGVVDFAVESDVPKKVLDAKAWKSVDLDEALRGATIQLRQLDVGMLAELGHARGRYKGRIDGILRVQPGTRALDLDVRGRGIETPGVKQAGFAVRGSWSHQALELGADFSLAENRVLAVQGKIPVGLHALVDGLVDLRAAPITVHAESHDLALEKLRPALVSKVRLAGMANFDADVAGTVAEPTAKVKLAIADARIARVSFQRFDADATLDPARIVAKISSRQTQGGTLGADATIDRRAGNAAKADLKARAFDLGFLPALARGSTDALAGVGGKLDADLHVSVAEGARTANGQATLRDGSFYVPSSGLVDRIQMTAKLENGRLTVDKLEGRAGSGSLSGNAQATLEGLLPRDFVASLDLNRLPVVAGPMVVTVDSKGKVQGKMDQGDIEMTATLHDTTVHVPRTTRAGGKLQSTGPLEDVVFVDTPDLMQRTAITAIGGDPDVSEGGGKNITIKLIAEGGVEVRGQEVQMDLRPDITVYQRSGLTTIGGGLEARSGFLELFGRRWDVNTINLTFEEDDPTMNPRLNIELQHEFTTTTVYIGVSGTVREPKLSLRAEPGSYEQGQILSWVLGGSPDEPAGEKASMGTKAASAASSVLLGQVQSQLRSVLPVDVLAVHVGEGADHSTTRIEVGKWLTDSLFLGYRGRVNAPENENQSEANIEWRLGKRWLIDAFYGDRSVGSADILWSKRY